LIKFSGPFQLSTSNFWAGVSDQPASWSWAENSLLLENISSPCLTWGVTYLFGNLRTRAKKPREWNFGVGSKILGSDWVGTCPKNDFLVI